MTMEQRGPELVRDDDLTRELATIYAAPREDAYWSALERRILASVSAGEGADEWWSVPDRWLRLGLVAAGIAVIVAGSLLMRTQAQASRMASYETAVDSAATDAFEVARRGRMTEEQATLRLLIGRD
jgi:hypothetical protein